MHLPSSLSETGPAATDGVVLRCFPCRANQEKIKQRQSILPPPQGPAPIPIQHDMRGSGMNRNRVAPPSQHDPGTGSTQQVCPGAGGLVSLDSQPPETACGHPRPCSAGAQGSPVFFSQCYSETQTRTKGTTICCISVCALQMLKNCVAANICTHWASSGHLLNGSSINQSS